MRRLRRTPTQTLFSVRSLLNRHPEEFVTETHGRAVNHLARELSAGRVNVITARAADRRQHAALNQLVAKLEYGRLWRALVARPRKRVEGNEIHLRRMAFEQSGQRTRLRRGIVYTIQHDVLERHAASVLLVDVVPTGGEELGDGVLAVDRYQLAAQPVIRRMQGDSQCHVGFLGQLVDLWHQAGGRQRDTPSR